MQHYKFWVEVLILIAVLRPEIYKDIIKFVQFAISNLKKANWKTFFRMSLKANGNYVRDAIEFDSELDKDRFLFKAASVNYAIYHNGNFGHAKNFSIRNESVSEQQFSLIGRLQQQSLAPYYKLIKMWESSSVIIIDVNDEANENTALTRFNLKSFGCHTLVLVPIAVPVNQVYPSTKVYLTMEIDGIKCAILGCYSVMLKDGSVPTSEEDLKIYFKSKIDVLRDYYIRTPNAVIK